MLVDVKMHRPHGDMELILNVIGNGAGVERVRQGVYLLGHWSPEHLIAEKIEDAEFSRDSLDWIERLLKDRPDDYLLKQHAKYQRVPETNFHKYENWKQNEDDESERLLNSYGVCDGPDQLLSLYDFEADPRQLFITMVHLTRGSQPRDGGWRWHKWGPYVGNKKPQCEYLHDEPEIEEVYTYHIYEVMR
jgi:hypothetical protein